MLILAAPALDALDPEQMQPLQSLEDLRTDRLDLFLLHYPQCWEGLCGNDEPEGTWKDSWRALEDAVLNGSVRAIGETLVRGMQISYDESQRSTRGWTRAVMLCRCFKF